jgi:hypothetical protein
MIRAIRDFNYERNKMPSDAKGESVRDLRGLFNTFSLSENSGSPESLNSPESTSAQQAPASASAPAPAPRRNHDRINPDTVLGGPMANNSARRHGSPEFSWALRQQTEHDGFSNPYTDR